MSNTNITFKQYVEQFNESKKQLEQALLRTPCEIKNYTVKNYCRLMVGRTLDEKQSVQLKPGHQIAVKWLYEDYDDPIPQIIEFKNVKTLDENNRHDLYWSGSQLLKWLVKNAD